MTSTETKLIRLLANKKEEERILSFDTLWESVKHLGESAKYVRLLLDSWVDIGLAAKFDHDSYGLTK